MTEGVFPFIRMNVREGKPRSLGVTEIRGPYYTPMGGRYLEDLFETRSAYVDALKFAGGSFALMPEWAPREIIELAHRHDVLVSTVGFIELVLAQGEEAVARYVGECRNLGFDIVEISTGFVTVSPGDWLRLLERFSGPAAGRRPGLSRTRAAKDAFSCHSDTFDLAPRRDSPEFPVWLIRNHVERAVGALPHVADPLPAIRQQVLFARHAVAFDD